MGVEKYIDKAAEIAATENGKKSIEQTLDTHEQQIVDIVLWLKNNAAIQKLSDQREQFSDDKKQELYESWSMGIWSTIKRSVELPPMWNLLTLIPSKSSIRENLFKKFTPAVRVLVHIWIFSRPEWLTDEKMKENITSDKEGLNRQVWILEKLCYVVPELMPIAPEVSKIKPLINVLAASQEKVLLAVNNATEKDAVVAHTQNEIYKNVSTDVAHLETQVSSSDLEKSVKKAA